MAAEKHDIQAIFNQAVARESKQDRAEFLDQACGGDPDVRQRVEKLLLAHSEAGGFFGGQSPAEPTCVSPVTEKPGDAIGPYKLLQQIGEGGMGTVFMAEQTEPVERRVALKIIKPGMDTHQVIARFEAERQALAMMDHPNIAKVLDAGATDTGRPYFVMELVKGMPVTQYCDEQHLTPRERLELFVPICHAVQHAHQKGIIHRDLKPSNILIARFDDKPVPKIIDFGVAKATSQKLTEKTMFTQYGQIVGTMEYMAPEQANFNQLDVDTRSDIYSLGVLLYELLTGETPFDKKRLRSAAFDELLRIIREEEPPRPSTKLSSSESLANTAVNRRTEPRKLSLLVRGELDWIVMKALEKDRARRYETASKFAEDVSHYLNNEAVLACPPSAAYKFRKFARRNKAVIATTAAVGLTLIAGIVGTTWQAIEAGTERDRAVIAEGKALTEADRATTAEELAKQRLTIVEAQKSEIETEKQNAVDEARRATNAEELAEQRLKEVQAEKEKVEQEKQIARAVQNFLQNKLLGQADVTAQADALRKLGKETFETKPNPTIRELLDRAAVELSAEKIEENFPRQPLLQAELLQTVGAAYRGVGEYQRAIEFLQRARELFERELGPDHPDTLATMSNLAVAYRDAGRLDQALPLFEETLKIDKEKLGPDHPSTLISMNNLAWVYEEAGKLDLALPLFEETLNLGKEKLGPDHRTTLASMSNLALAYRDAGRLDQALPLLEEMLKLQKESLGSEHPSTLISMSNLAQAYQEAGQRDRALPLMEETLKLLKEKLGPDHPYTLISMNNLALAYGAAGQLDRALPLFEETLKIKEAKLNPPESKTQISGKIVNPNEQYGLAADYRLAADAVLGWKTGQLPCDVNLNGHHFKMDTGGGNQTIFFGAISGDGDFTWSGGGSNLAWQTTPSFLAGSRPNSFSGTLTLLRGTLGLCKPKGVCAVSGERLILGGGSNQAIVQLWASEQIDDSCNVVLTGEHEGRIATRGHSETIGSLQVQSMGYIDLGEGNSALAFADSSQTEWDPSKTLTIQNWTAEKDTIRFGNNASGLSHKQLEQIRFENPSELPPGTYSAKILTDGRVVPDQIIATTNPHAATEQANSTK